MQSSISAGVKTCTKCGIEKLQSQFYRCARSHDGFQTYCKECAKQYHKDNSERVYVTHKNYRLTHRDAAHMTNRKYYEAHRLEHIEYTMQWARDHPEAKHATDQKYRGRRSSALGSYTGKEFKELCIHMGWVCIYCGELLTPKTACADHMTPLSRGGDNTIDNIVPSCSSCNSRKGTKTVEEFLQYLEVIDDRLRKSSIPV